MSLFTLFQRQTEFQQDTEMRAGQNETAGGAGVPGTPDNSVNPAIQVQPSSFPLERLTGNRQLNDNCTKSSPSSDPQLHPQGQTAIEGSRPNITATHPLSICNQTGMSTDYDILMTPTRCSPMPSPSTAIVPTGTEPRQCAPLPSPSHRRPRASRSPTPAKFPRQGPLTAQNEKVSRRSPSRVETDHAIIGLGTESKDSRAGELANEAFDRDTSGTDSFLKTSGK
jgi:hypothetical protein